MNLTLQLQVNEQQARTSTAGSMQTQTRNNINVNAQVVYSITTSWIILHFSMILTVVCVYVAEQQARTSIAEEATTTNHTRTRTFANANIVVIKAKHYFT